MFMLLINTLNQFLQQEKKKCRGHQAKKKKILFWKKCNKKIFLSFPSCSLNLDKGKPVFFCPLRWFARWKLGFNFGQTPGKGRDYGIRVMGARGALNWKQCCWKIKHGIEKSPREWASLIRILVGLEKKCINKLFLKHWDLGNISWASCGSFPCGFSHV